MINYKQSLQFRSLDGNIFRYLGQFCPGTSDYSPYARALWRTVVITKTTLIIVT